MTGKWIAGGIFAAVAAVVMALIAAHALGYLSVFPEPAKQIELLSVYLGAATLAVTVAAFAIAILGAFGYQAIKTAAIEAGREAGAAAGERAIAPILARERLASGLDIGAQTTEGAFDPLTSELAPKAER